MAVAVSVADVESGVSRHNIIPLSGVLLAVGDESLKDLYAHGIISVVKTT